ncbi:gamma-glutamylcyclotransferase-like [Osmerus eperlanus]|uniref:gamma-glutamylcyclotransferase-like n=1 Tax=Osmerus eperlanus TaxID=29151 RepID=UPI002E112A24
MYCILYYTVGLALFQPLLAATVVQVDKDYKSSNTSTDFLYFAYGSNLLKERLQLKNPSAEFVRTGRLKDYSLRFGHWREDFNGSNSWHGGVATIQPVKGEDVWGVIWKMDTSNLISLDKQEGVKGGSYSPTEVTVDTEDGLVVCRTYLMNNFKAYLTSPPYKQVVCLGARQNGLPLEYIKKLDAVETNGYSGPSIMDDIIGFKPTGNPQLESPETTSKKRNPFFSWLYWLS